MRTSLSALCGSFIENRDMIKDTFRWESVYLYPVCAAVFTDRGRRADRERMERCRDILKEQTGFFSSFRSTVKLAVIAMMAVDSDPEGKLQRAQQVYSRLREHFFASDYLPVASMIIAELVEPSGYEAAAVRTRHIYELMKQEHPFLTSGEDSVYAALLALSGQPDEQVAGETERCYELLKPDFFSGNAVQALSHVLALGEGAAEDKCKRVMELYHGLKEKGCKYGTDYELATLGVLAMLPADSGAIIKDMTETDDFLACQKGYGLLGIGKKQRLMHAAMLVSADYIGRPASTGNPVDTVHSSNISIYPAAIGGTISLIAAQQAAMCAAIAASSAAAASAGRVN